MRIRSWLGVILGALLLNACGNSGIGTTPTATPQPSGSVFPTPNRATVVVLADSPQGPGEPTVRTSFVSMAQKQLS